MMVYNISQFTKNSLSGQGQFGSNLVQNYANLYLMIHSLRIFLKFFGMMRHQTKVVLVTCPKKIPFCAIQAHLAQNYRTNCSRDFKKYSSKMWCNSETLVIFVNFPKNSLFGLVAIQTKIMQLYTHDLLCDKCFDMTQHGGIQQLDQSNVGQLFQNILFQGS